MRAALVIYGSLETVTGGYLYDRMLVQRLRTQGHEVRVISMREGRYGTSVLRNLSYRSPDDIDLVLQDELNHPSLFIANRIRRSPPVVAIVHHLRSSERRAPWQNALIRVIEKSYLQTVDAFIFNSNTTRRSVQGLVGAEKPWVVATPGGDRLGVMDAADVSMRAEEPGPLRLLFAGSLTRAKGLHVLLDALAYLDRGTYQLRVAGSARPGDRFAADIQERATEQSQSVEICGLLSAEELEKEMRAAHVFVLPSFYEGFGIAFLEAMAHGLVCIGARAGAVPEVVEDGATGFLIEPGDGRGLARHIAILQRDRQLLGTMGMAAVRRFRGFPTWDSSAAIANDFLLRLASSGRSMQNP